MKNKLRDISNMVPEKVHLVCWDDSTDGMMVESAHGTIKGADQEVNKLSRENEDSRNDYYITSFNLKCKSYVIPEKVHLVCWDDSTDGMMVESVHGTTEEASQETESLSKKSESSKHRYYQETRYFLE